MVCAPSKPPKGVQRASEAAGERGSGGLIVSARGSFEPGGGRLSHRFPAKDLAKARITFQVLSSPSKTVLRPCSSIGGSPM
jgi:hypothetical protein